MSRTINKIAIYGGNGFIGTHIARTLSELGADVVCISRTGHKPLYLNNDAWSSKVKWCKGDAAQPDHDLLRICDALICCVGSPPLPTFGRAAYERQLKSNGSSCVSAIEAASKAGVNNLIILSAQIPWVLQTKYFAYYVGKQQVIAAAEKFAALSDGHSALILKPGVVTGIRTLSSGKRLRIDWFTAPVAPIMPWQFVTVDRVAERIADAFTNQELYKGKCITLKNKEI
ncbi:MAG: NAD(P)-dependent oxidoreductase [Gammaproteobacteria bacterium]|nr:NAD(P)-dependent oxidoreductase [Gammaproteobacteria bacterium]